MDSEALYDADRRALRTGNLLHGVHSSRTTTVRPAFFRSPGGSQSRRTAGASFPQSVWAAIEDAGYTRESLKKRYPKHGERGRRRLCGVTRIPISCRVGRRQPRRRRSSSSLPCRSPIAFPTFRFRGRACHRYACSSPGGDHLACESLRAGLSDRDRGGVICICIRQYHALCQNACSPPGEMPSYGRRRRFVRGGRSAR